MPNVSSFAKKYAKKDSKYLLDNLMRVSGHLEISRGPINVGFAGILWFLVAIVAMTPSEWWMKLIIFIIIIVLVIFLKKRFPIWGDKLSKLEEERVFLQEILANEKLRKEIFK